jgi:hypothetical protein
MPNTATGLPYPVGTSKVVAGDNDIKALADALTAQLPQVKLKFFNAGATTNGTGDIAIVTGLTTINGIVAIMYGTTVAAMTCMRLNGAPAGQVWLRVFTSSAVLANTAVVYNAMVWGS